MKAVLGEPRFDQVSSDDKAFMLAWDEEMAKLGYRFGGQIGDGYCWGRYMVVYRKAGVKSKKVHARERIGRSPQT